MIRTDERYVIASKTTPAKYPLDERNKFYEKGDTTFDVFETYKYIEESLASEVFEKNGYNAKDFEVKKIVFTYEVF
jgi:hypothetical protein